MALETHSNLTRVCIQDIDAVQIKSLGVSGVGEQVSFELIDIDRLHVETGAFHHTSETLGHSLMLQNIQMLDLNSNAFQTYAARMHLSNVVMEVCHPQSFGGNIPTIMLDNVNISETKEGCFTGLDKRTTLRVRSSRIDTVHPGALSGKLRDLTIENSDFLTMHEKALDLQLVSMKVSGLFVRHLSSDGLTVTADDSILLEDVTIESLKRRALAGLLIEPTPFGYCPPLVIRGMQISEVESGSLALSECADLQVSELRVRSLPSRYCPTERLTRWLSELSDRDHRGPLSTAQYSIYWELYGHDLCENDVYESTFPVAAHKQCCEPGARRPTTRGGPGPAGESASPAPGDHQHHKPEEEATTTSIVHSKRQQMPLQDNDVKNPDVPTDLDRNGTAVRRPGGAGASGSAPDAALAEHQHRLVLYLTLGAVLAVTLVLATALLMVTLHRRRRRSGTSRTSSIAETPPEVETLLMVIANRLNRLLRLEKEHDGSGRPGGRPGAPPGSGRSSVSSHQYETIRPELLLSPPQYEPIRPELLLSPPQYEPLIRFDDSPDDSRAEPPYCNLLER